MRSSLSRLVLVGAVVGSALLQGCAVTTGGFAPSRSGVTNRSMTSHYDVTRAGSGPSQYRAVRTTHERGLWDYKYY
jgi:hypothetical protein